MNILVIVNSPFNSGAEKSLIEYLQECSKLHKYYVCVSKRNLELISQLSHYELIPLPLISFVKTYNPLLLTKYLLNVLCISFKIKKIIIEKKIDLVYSNSIKGQIYSLPVKKVTRKPSILHVRDNIKSGLLYKLLISNSDQVICVSNHIYQQIPENGKVIKKIIYGGIPVDQWQNKNTRNAQSLRKELNILHDKLLIAQIGQITRWKNQTDFIRCAKIVKSKLENAHFIITGSSHSFNDKIFLRSLRREIIDNELSCSLSIIEFKQNIKEIYSQIDIILHPAINEPFGRVLIEAMAMEKPVVAYNCGGPKEIVVNGETGYLVEPYDFRGLADKTIHLLQNNDLRMQFGKEGRKRVIEKFNIERNVKEMEDIFNNV